MRSTLGQGLGWQMPVCAQASPAALLTAMPAAPLGKYNLTLLGQAACGPDLEPCLL